MGSWIFSGVVDDRFLRCGWRASTFGWNDKMRRGRWSIIGGMKTFRERLEDGRAILLDGATGSELTRRGVKTELPLWGSWALLDAPEVLGAIHLDYLRAGAEVVTTNTFRTHRRNLALAGMGERAGELTGKAVEIARGAVDAFVAEGGHDAWVAGSIAPLEDCYSPELVPEQADCMREHGEMVGHLAAAGVDVILIETMNMIREAEAAARAAAESGLPFIVSFVLRTDGRLFSGESLEEAAKALRQYNPMMIGVNCTPSTMITESLKELGGHTDLPVSGYGNIGHTDEIDGWEVTDDVSPAAYGALAGTWAEMGVRMIGGCCGTSPAHIEAVQGVLSGG